MINIQGYPCVFHLVLERYCRFAYQLLWTSYCWHINILVSGWDWNQTSTIACINRLIQLYVFTPNN